MRLLVVSHACVTPLNQGFYADVERASGWEVSLVVPSSWRTEYKPSTEASRWNGFKGALHALPVWKPGSVPLHIYKNNVIQLLRKEKPDAIYVHHEPYGLATFQFYMANRLTGSCPIGFYAAQNIAKTYPLPIRLAERAVFHASSFCFPVTRGALSVLQSRGYKGRADVLPLAIDRTIYYPRKVWAQEQRKASGVAPDEFTIGYIGRFVEEKGIRTLLRSLALLQEQRWRCVLVGTGPDEGNLRALAKELHISERVLFPGYVPHEEAPGWMTLFDVLVLPSETRPHWKEQFGRVIIEANACGTPVIGSDSGEIPNVIKETGGGITFPEGDSTALAAAVLLLMNDPAKRDALATYAEQVIDASYGQEHLASRFINVIADAVERKAKPPRATA